MDRDLAWTDVEDGYTVALDPESEPRPELVCRNASGRELKKLPPKLRNDPGVRRLRAFADWLGEHAEAAESAAERWMTRSLPVPAALVRAVWPDPYWRRTLRYLAVAPYGDIGRAGLLTAVGPGGGLAVVSPDGEHRVDADLLAVPHPVLLDPRGTGRLERWRALLDDFGGEQRVEQLEREVWHRPESAPERHREAARRGIDAFRGAEFSSGALFEKALGRFGGRVRGETAHLSFFEAGWHALAIELRYQGPQAPVGMRDLHWRSTGQRHGRGAYDTVPRVAWSEGIRAVAALYGARDGWFNERDPEDAGTKYQRFLVRCAEPTAARTDDTDDANGDANGDGHADVGGPAPEPGCGDGELLGAGAVLLGEPDTGDGQGQRQERLVARRYTWPALDAEDRIVTLVPARSSAGEDAVASAVGLTADDAEPLPVGRVRARRPGFLVRVCAVHPGHVHRAMGLLGTLRRCADTAPAKPGRAAKALEEAVRPLEKQAPELVPHMLEEGARIIGEAGSAAMARPLFDKAREAERRHSLPVDERALTESVLELARLGAVSGSWLQRYREDLAAALPADEAAGRYRRLILAWHRSGLESRPFFAQDLLKTVAGGVAPADDEHLEALDGLLRKHGMDRQPAAVWEGWTPALLRLASRRPRTRALLLKEFAAPKGGSRAARAAAAEYWIGTLRESGAAALLTDAEATTAAEVHAWLDRFLDTYKGLRLPVAGLPELLARIGERLSAEGASRDPLGHLMLPTRQWPEQDCPDLELLDTLLAAGVPVRGTSASGAWRLPLWLRRIGGGRLDTLVADERFRPRLLAELADPRPALFLLPPGRVLHGDAKALKALHRSEPLRGLVAEHLERCAAEAADGALPALHRALLQLETFGSGGGFGDERFARLTAPYQDAIREADPVAALARTLRIGLPDELVDPEAPSDRTAAAKWLYDNQSRTRSGAQTAVVQEKVVLPGDAEPRTVALTLGADGVAGLSTADGTTSAEWTAGYEGYWAYRCHRWAAGSARALPPGHWHRLVPRDRPGSTRLRTADRATAAALLDAVAAEDRERTFAAVVADRTHGVPVERTEDGGPWAPYRSAVGTVLPEITDEGLADGVAGALWTAAECMERVTRLRRTDTSG